MTHDSDDAPWTFRPSSDYADLRAKALAICDPVVAQDRQLTEAEQHELAGLVEQASERTARTTKPRRARAESSASPVA